MARAESRATGSNGGAVAGSLTPTPPVPQFVRVLGSTTTTSLNQTIQTTVQSTTVEAVARPALTLTGWFGGLDRWLMGSSVFMETIKGDAEVVLDPANNRVQADFSNFVLNVNNPRTKSGHVQFGSIDPSRPANSTYTSYNDFAAVALGDVDGFPIAATISNVSRSTALQVAAARGAPNLTICECDYTRWGVWQSEALYNYGDAEPERLFGTWVAGRPTTIAEMPTVGRATYIGHVVANAQDISLNPYSGNATPIGNSRLIGGNFTNTVDFGARNGAVTVTGLDHTNYAGTVTFLGDPRRFAGTLAGDYGNRQMGLSGSFFRGIASPVGEMGGSVTLKGTNYIGSGIFAARMK